jgi:uncharacterized circularly permuted ATP-grasp superfamily protein/uncharacterized alpha-E superfamily protein
VRNDAGVNGTVLRYQPTRGTYDDVVGPDGDERGSWRDVSRALGGFEPALLLDRQRAASRLLDAEGTGHLVHELALATDRHGHTAGERAASRPWRLDPIPMVLEADEFRSLSAALVERLTAVEAVVADCYGARELVQQAVIAPGLLYSLPGFRPSPGSVPSWLCHAAVDLVRDATGAWRVVADLTDAPSGLGYSLLNRSVLARVVPQGLRTARVAPVHPHGDALRRALIAVAPAGRASPRAVVLTPGPADATYVEHSYLATRLGLHLVESGDVVMREGRLWLRVLDGLEPIDVVYRRVADARLDPLEPGHEVSGDGVPGLVWGSGRGLVSLANPYGSGLAESHEFAAVLGDASQALLGHGLSLPLWSPADGLATSPVFVGDSRQPLEPRAVVLRVQVVRTAAGFEVMPGGAGRVLAPGDHPSHPTSQITKDVWVVGTTGAVRAIDVASPPQVDFGGSVPTRVADALYWLGRAAEHAETVARATRVVATQLEQDPALVMLADGGWSLGVVAMLRAAEGVVAEPVDGQLPLRDVVERELVAGTVATAAQLAALVQETASVREYLSTATGRVLGRLARSHSVLLDGPSSSDELDMVLVDLAALSGLSTESTVRGPAWRFLDMGRRLERSLSLLGAIEAALGPAVGRAAAQPLADALLQANESLVAYRRRYRSDVDVGAVLDLLVHDDANPRGLAFQLDRLREHVAGLAWHEGVQLVSDASIASLATVDAAVVNGRRLSLDALVLGVRAPLLQLAEAIVSRWFADPVHPTIVRGR